MTLASVHAPHLGRHVTFGRVRKTHLRCALRLRDFLPQISQTVPGAIDYGAKARPALREIYGNDSVGDCVEAGGYHSLGVVTGNAVGDPFIATGEEVLRDYSAITGYDPDRPETDQGTDELEAFAYWSKQGFADGTKLAGVVELDASNVAEIKLATFAFENLCFGVALPDGFVSPFPSADGFVWDDSAGPPNPRQGHCFIADGYDDDGLLIDTWGLTGRITFPAVAKYAGDEASGGQLYALLFDHQIAEGQQRAPNGLCWAELLAAIKDLGGNVYATAA